MIDREVTVAQVQGLNGADAVAAFFAGLGYNTDARLAQSAGNLGVTNETLQRQIRRLELLADHEGQLQVYLTELSSLTLAAVRGLAAAFRNRPGNYLLVLTADYERLDFVLLKKMAPPREPGQPMAQRQVVVRPRILTIDRRNPSRVHLRVLRRLSYSESDPFAQHDKLQSAFDVAEWSEEHFNNRALFSDHFLRERLPDFPEWLEDPKPAFQALRKLFERAAGRWAGKDETEVRAGLIEPALRHLGFTPRAVKEAGDDKPTADYLLHAADGPALASCLAYTWNRSLDTKDDTRDRLTPEENPGAVVVSLLESGATRWAIVTNGKHWRLYAKRTHSRATNYYEIDLEETLALGDADAFRYFWLLFRREALDAAPPAAEGALSPACFIDRLIDGSEDYAKRLGEDLKDRVFEKIFVVLAEGFIADMRRRGEMPAAPGDEALAEVFHGTLTLLYRLLFLLYAEARNLLPVAEERGYGPASLTQLKREIAEVAGTIVDEAQRRIERHYDAGSTSLYDRLSQLFCVIARGDPALNVPVYNGGLFVSEVDDADESPAAASARFLLRYKVPDRLVARALDFLARDIDRKTHALAFIDYKSLGVRQLGSIYEGLLEFRLRIAGEKLAVCKGKRTEEIVPYRTAQAKNLKILKRGSARDADDLVLPKGAVYLENDRRERKATGSYYTPDFIVQYIVAHAVGPILQEHLKRLAPSFRAAQKTLVEERKKFQALQGRGDPPDHQAYLRHRDLVDQIFDFRVADPAMGSGHFLVEVVDFVTDRLLDFLNGFPWNPVAVELSETRDAILREMETQHVAIDPARLTDVNLLKRHVLKRCVYGVDLNPMAVELAKVSLWLDCFTLGAPLSFLDHHLKGGNSLLGAWIETVRGVVQGDLFGSQFAGLVSATEAMIHVGELSDVTVEQVHESARAFRDASVILAPFKEVLDLWASQHHGNGEARALLMSGGFPAIAAGWQARLGGKGKPVLEAAAVATRERGFFHWELEFPELFFSRGARKARTGFDAVIGNPPWIRQESLAGDKQALRASFEEVFDSVADTYVFFLARALAVLAPAGRIGMIVPNKWLRAAYGENLRKHLVATAPPIEIVDFGHAPLFPDADTFPCVVVLESAPDGEAKRAVSICSVPREQLDGLDLPRFVSRSSHKLPISRLRPEGWDLENVAVADLLEKIRRAGMPLRQYVGSAPLYGIKTGLNEAFLIDQATRDRLVAEDPKCEPIIKKFLRGRDIQRWHPEWGGQWMIVLKSSENAEWPWANADAKAEAVFAKAYRSLYRWFKRFEEKLRKREDRGRYWWELRSCDYYGIFDAAKILYPDIAFHSCFAVDSSGLLANDTCFFVRGDDFYLLALLNSTVMWWYLARTAIRGKDEAFRQKSIYMENLPIPGLTNHEREQVREKTARLIELSRRRYEASNEFFAGLERAVGSVKRSDRLETFWDLDPRVLASEIRRCSTSRPSAPALAKATSIHEKHTQAMLPLVAEIARHEIALHEVIFGLYGFDEADVRLLRATAPPRDPLALAEAQLAAIGRDPSREAREAG